MGVGAGQWKGWGWPMPRARICCPCLALAASLHRVAKAYGGGACVRFAKIALPSSYQECSLFSRRRQRDARL